MFIVQNHRLTSMKGLADYELKKYFDTYIIITCHAVDNL